MIKNPPIIKKIAKEMGASIEEVIPERGYFYLNFKNKKILISRKFKISNDFVTGGETTKFKDLTHFLFKKNNIPTPKTVCLYKKNLKKEDIVKKLSVLKYPIIIKDAQGSNSRGIFANIKNINEAIKIILTNIKKFPRLIVQEMVFGNEYRLLILDNKLIAALRLIPPRVIGDGKTDIRKLIKKKQKNNRKKTPLDKELKAILKEQGFELRSIPPKNVAVFIRKNSSLDEGGEREDVTEKVNPDIIKTGIKASRVLGKTLAGIDLICDDISRKTNNQNLNMIEVNGKPDIYIHYNPNIGKTRDVVREIITYILKNKKK